jgi:hypothetical protein
MEAQDCLENDMNYKDKDGSTWRIVRSSVN